MEDEGEEPFHLQYTYWSKSAASKYCQTLNLLKATMTGIARRWEL